jgi:HTH-type transcriptional regulator/antitoxin HipB
MKEYPVKTPKQLGSILQGFRKDKLLTQAQVGERIGLLQKEVSKLELDSTNASLNRIFKLLAALELELVVRPRGTVHHASDW